MFSECFSEQQQQHAVAKHGVGPHLSFPPTQGGAIFTILPPKEDPN